MANKVMRTAFVVASIAALGTIGATVSQAATQTDTFDVTATIIASCTISAGDLAFGNYDPLSATPNDNTSTIAITARMAPVTTFCSTVVLQLTSQTAPWTTMLPLLNS